VPRTPAADRIEVGGVDPLRRDLLAQLANVVAFVTVLGYLLAAHAGGDRGGETGDLTAGVVDVELALDLVANRLEQADQGVAVGGMTAAADVERAGWVGGDELDQDSFRRLDRSRAERLPRRRQARHRAPVPAVGEEEVDETGAGHLDPLDGLGSELLGQVDGKPGSDVAWVFPQRRGEQHRRVGAVVAQLGLGWPLQRWLGPSRLTGAQRKRGTVDCRAQLGDRVSCNRHRAHRMEGRALSVPWHARGH
jgi:hypothetical protein